MFYENNTHHTLFIYMSDGEQDLSDKLVTFNIIMLCVIFGQQFLQILKAIKLNCLSRIHFSCMLKFESATVTD